MLIVLLKAEQLKIENYSNSYDDKNSDSGLIATLVSQPVALAQDKDYIYAIATVAITDTDPNANLTGGTTTSAAVAITGTESAKTTVRTYLQKISKAQGDQQDDAYLPKTVESYEIGNYLSNEYDCSDAHDAYDAILTTIQDAQASTSRTKSTDLRSFNSR